MSAEYKRVEALGAESRLVSIHLDVPKSVRSTHRPSSFYENTVPNNEIDCLCDQETSR